MLSHVPKGGNTKEAQESRVLPSKTHLHKGAVITVQGGGHSRGIQASLGQGYFQGRLQIAVQEGLWGSDLVGGAAEAAFCLHFKKGEEMSILSTKGMGGDYRGGSQATLWLCPYGCPWQSDLASVWPDFPICQVSLVTSTPQNGSEA